MLPLSRLISRPAVTAWSRGFAACRLPQLAFASRWQQPAAVLTRRTLTTTTPVCRGGAAANTHDAKLSSLLDSELRFESSATDPQQSQRRQPQPPPGFAVTAREQGTRFTLTKKCQDGSLLEVSFDLNGSTATMDEEAHDDEGDEGMETAAATAGQSGQGRDPRHSGDADAEDTGEEIQSRPDLVIRIRKPTAKTCLAVRCSFPPVHVSRQLASEDPDYPSLSIDTVAVEGDPLAAELGEYEMDADMLNDDLYKQLAEMLVHRGVTREFENSLVEFCTAQEHQLYLRFLAEAKKFCDA